MQKNSILKKIEYTLRRSGEYNHIPSLKGKRAKRNIFILFSLAANGEQSCWDLALDYIKTFRAQDYNRWCKDPHFKAILYHEQQKENGKLYRLLAYLLRKQYVEKKGSKYSLTLKGYLFAFVLFPETLKNRIPEILKISDNEIQALLEKVYFPLIPNSNALNRFRKFLSNLQEEHLALEFFNSAVKATIQHIILDYKINLDEISEKELMNLLYSEILKLFSKYSEEKLG